MSVPPSDERPGPSRTTPRAGPVSTPTTGRTAAEPAGRRRRRIRPTAAPPAGIDFEDRWRRAVADLDNVRKRHARDLVQERAAERARVAAAFLPVLDTIDLALAHAEADPNADRRGRPGRARPGAGRAVRARLPARRTTSVCRSTRSATRWSRSSARGGRAARRVGGRRAAAGLRRTRTAAATRGRHRGRRGRGVSRGARLLRRARGRVATPARRRSQAPTGGWPGPTTRT